MSPAIDDIMQQKLNKLNSLRESGIEPFPYGYHRTHTAREAVANIEANKEQLASQEFVVNLAGRIMSKRGMGKTCFMDLVDGSGKIQLFFRINNLESKYDQIKYLDIGDIVGAEGKLFLTRTQEPTIEVRNFTLLAKALQPLPEKWHGLVDVEKRYRQRYLDLISNPEAKKVFEIRSKTLTAVRDFLNRRGFMEVETPVLQPEAGGASAKPFITHYNALDRDFYLRIALELHLKRLIIGGFEKVYEMGHVFRNEGIDFKHNPEYTLLETYEAYVDYLDVMKMVEEMISSVCQQVLGTMKIEYNGQTLDFTPPWKRIEMRQAIIQYAGIDIEQFRDTESLRNEMLRRNIQFDQSKERGKLIDELVSTFVDPHLIQPTFMYDYPIEMSPLAKKKPGSEHIVERFEPYVAGMEIGNAFTELNDPIDQRQRFQKQVEERARGDEEAQGLDEDFVTAMEHGMPPTGGLGIGIDRVVMLFTNQTSIREVILFPALKEK
ncbi:MAG TPA: lysine--tRNA ligase [Dehalococcoidales bacterium]|nr:lysine--tRNA ligase [Dehalococcoidales bacterium]